MKKEPRRGAGRWLWWLANLVATWQLLNVVWLEALQRNYHGDAYGYWLADLGNLYNIAWGQQSASPYSPAFHLAIEPIAALPWIGFYAIWLLLILGSASWLVSPLGALLLISFQSPLRQDLLSGNIHTLVALSVVLSFRYPVTWAFPLLTKLTPGIGLIWYAVRRDWRAVRIALIATAIGLLIGLVLLPEDSLRWPGYLAGSMGATAPEGAFISVPLLIRLPIAAGIIALGARMNWPWLLPFGIYLSTPSIWFGALCLLLAVPRLVHRVEHEPGQVLATDRPDAGRVGANLEDELVGRRQRQRLADDLLVNTKG